MSGAVDLKQMVGVGVEVVPVEDAASIVRAVRQIRSDDDDIVAQAMEAARKSLDWKSYAARYEMMLLEYLQSPLEC